VVSAAGVNSGLTAAGDIGVSAESFGEGSVDEEGGFAEGTEVRRLMPGGRGAWRAFS
jgi:hypothetical protein